MMCYLCYSSFWIWFYIWKCWILIVVIFFWTLKFLFGFLPISLIISHHAINFQMWHYQIWHTLFMSHFFVETDGVMLSRLECTKGRFTWSPKSQHRGKVPTFEPPKTIEIWLTIIKVGFGVFCVKTFVRLVLRVGSSFLLKPTLNTSLKPHFQKVLSCRHHIVLGGLGI